MSSAPTMLRKTYSEPFVLDRGKLSRMITIVEQRLGENHGQIAHFEVSLKNDKRLTLSSLQDVLALDNSVRNPIRELSVMIQEEEKDKESEDDQRTARVRLHFDSDRESNIALVVTSENAKLATELFDELEEQIDRVLVSSWIAKVKKSERVWFVLVFLISTFFAAFSISQATGDLSKHVSKRDSEELQALLTSAKSEQEKIDALVQTQERELRALNSQPSFRFANVFSLRGAFIALPLLILLGTFAYMVIACYPWAVFSWGDFEQHYADLVSRRKNLGVVVIAALLIGIIGNLFVASIPLR